MKQMIKTSILLLALLMPATAIAYDFMVDSIYYVFNDNGGVSVATRDQNYNSYSGDVVIPSTVTHDGITYTVTAIDVGAFTQSAELTSVVLPPTITRIGGSAFSKCTKMKDVIIPESVTVIGSYAFSNCNGLRNMVIPDGVDSIASRAFWECRYLASIHIGRSVRFIGESQFRGSWSLSSITVDSENPYFDSREDCQAIIEKATNTLLFGCRTSTIPYGVTKIAHSAFVTQSITDVTIPSTVTEIEDYAFLYTSLRGIDIPNSVTYIGEGAFYGCDYMNHVTLGNSVKYIGIDAFRDSENITSIHIPSSVEFIGKRAFSTCELLDTITVASDNPYYDSRDNCNAIIETATNRLISGCNKTVIPSTVTTIGELAFHFFPYLRSILIPSNVTSIEYLAFFGCSGLSDVFCYNPDPSLIAMANGTFKLNSNRYDFRTLHVPNGSESAYQAAPQWPLYFGNIVGFDPETVLTTSITLNRKQTKLYMGKHLRLTATVLPDNAADKSVTWRSGDERILTVDENGVMTPVKTGRTYVTATTNDGRNLNARCEVTVESFHCDINMCTQIIDYLLGGELPYYLDEDDADVNGDGIVNIEDVTELIDLLLQSE